jgi:hypothetical protein
MDVRTRASAGFLGSVAGGFSIFCTRHFAQRVERLSLTPITCVESAGAR